MIILEILIVAIIIAVGIRQMIDQWGCDHTGGVNETRSCDAICKLCGKNLGFIGSEENKIRRTQ